MALTQNFVRVATKEVGNYLDHKTIPYPKKPDPLFDCNLEGFSMGLFNWYHWSTLSFRTDEMYDLFRVYDGDELVLETEDVVVECPSWFTPNNQTHVFAYKGDKAVAEWNFSTPIPPRDRKKNYKLSVVVPLYKWELFMCRTIDSILSSTLEDIELILIDDGSPDKSYDIAQRYAENYWCVRAVTQENQGVSITRNEWLKLATWEYMAFCDGDDVVHPDMYRKLYKACKDNKSDIAIAQTLIRKGMWDKEFYLQCSARPEDIVVYDFDEMFKNRGSKGNIFFVAVWNKIVKTEVARMAKFPTEYTWPWVLYEDVAYTWSLYSYIDKFVFVRDAYYTWDKRKQKTVWTASTWHSKYDNEYVWKMFIYGFSYMLYNKSWKHLERHDYTHFKRLIESYDKFDRPSPLRTYWDEKLKELVNSQKLYDNKLIMANDHLKEVVERVR